MMSVEKIATYALISVGILSGGIILFTVAKYILPVLAPFIFAWLVAMATDAPATSMSKRMRVPSKVLRLMMSLFLAILVFGGTSILLWRLAVAAGRFLTDLGQGNRLYELLNLFTSSKPPIFGNGLSEEAAEQIGEAIRNALSSALSKLGGIVTSAAGAVPKIFLFTVVTLISLIYFSLDLEKINSTVRALLPKKLCRILSKLKNGIFFVAKKYLRSYFIIMMITYSVMLLGFLFLRVEHAPLIALIVAFLDILPVIGVGTVILPWSIVEIATGNRFLGIGLLILFVINTIVRQLSEPKIVGKNLDVHPILTLVMLYSGYALFGFFGLVIFPVIAVSIGVTLKKNHSTEVG